MASKRYEPLRRRKDFLELRATGISFHVNSWLLVNVRTSAHGSVRCGWTIPRQVGTAVVRNRFRRWGREFLRVWAAETGLELDMNMVFKRKDKGFYKSVSHEDFDGALAKMVERLGRQFEPRT